MTAPTLAGAVVLHGTPDPGFPVAYRIEAGGTWLGDIAQGGDTWWRVLRLASGTPPSQPATLLSSRDDALIRVLRAAGTMPADAIDPPAHEIREGHE